MHEYFVIDAFADRPCSGNAAAVVLDADGLSDHVMQRLAAEFNLSETTFVLRPEDARADVRFRWMTPAVEVSLCGHATLAGMRALYELGRISPPSTASGSQLAIETKSGVLRGFVEQMPGADGTMVFWLELPDPQLTESDDSLDELAAALGVPVSNFVSGVPVVRTQDGDAIVSVESTQALFAIAPDFAFLTAWQHRCAVRGLCVATTNTLTQAIHVQSRFFAPVCGVDEDPVTGSVHGPLAAYVIHYGFVPRGGDITALCCHQSRRGGRGGTVYALVGQGDAGSYSVRIGGRTVPVMRGRLLPDDDTADVRR